MAINCVLINGHEYPFCIKGMGGVKSLYITPFSGSTTFTIDADDVITQINSGTTFYKFDLTSFTAEANDDATGTPENESLYYTQIVSLQIPRLRAAVRNQMVVLAKSKVRIIAESMNGELILYGKETGMDLTTGKAAMGKSGGDLNGYQLSFQSFEPVAGYHVTALSAFTYSY